MKNNHLSQGKIVEYLSDVLKKKERDKVDLHLKLCKKCKKGVNELGKIRNILIHPPEIDPEDRVDIILKKIKKERIKHTNFIDKLKSKLRLLSYPRIIKIGISFALVSLIIMGSLLYFNFLRNDYCYIVKAYGDVKINNISIDFNSQYKYKLKNKMHINVNMGECVVQINNNKLILLKDNTYVKIVSSTNIVVHLDQGELLGKVIKKKNQKNLLINSDQYQFAVIGTVFSVEKSEEKISCAVYKGLIKSIFPEKVINIKQGEKLIKSLKKNITVLPIKKIEKYKFIAFNKTNPIDNFKNMEKSYIVSTPSKAEIFYQKQLLGISPLYVLMDKNNLTDLYITKSSFSSKEIHLGESENGIVKIQLSRSSPYRINWQKHFNNKIYISPSVINHNIVLLDAKGFIYNIDIPKRKIKWKAKTGMRLTSKPLFWKNVLYVPSNQDYIYAIDFNTGKIKWQTKIGFVVYSAPSQYKERLYLCNSYGEIYCLNINNGKVLWREKFNKGFFMAPVIYNDILYIGGLGGHLYAIDLKSHKKIWTFETGNRILTTPLIKNNTIFFGSHDQYIYALNIRSGKLKWRFKTDGSIFASPQSIDNNVLISSMNGTLYSLSSYNGALNWKYRTGMTSINTPIIFGKKYVCFYNEKKIYIMTKWGKLFNRFNFSSQGLDINNNRDMIIFSQNNQLYNLSLIF